MTTSTASAAPAARARPLPPLAHDPQRADRGDAWLPYGDAMRVLGTVAVVVGHCCDMFFYNAGWAAQRPGGWWAVNVADAAARFAVPLFIMLSGAVLLDPGRGQGARAFYRKRLARLGVPILFWTPLFLALEVLWLGWKTPRGALESLLHGEPYAHLHFVFRIFGLYAITPLLRLLVAAVTRRQLLMIAGVALALGAVDSWIGAYTGDRASAVLRFVPFVGYFLAGWCLRDARLSSGGAVAAAAVFLASVAALAGGTGLLVERYGLHPYPSMGMVLYDFLSPVRIVMAISAWLLLATLCRPGRALGFLSGGRFAALSALTLGVYLLHPLLRELLMYKLGISLDTFLNRPWPLALSLVALPAMILAPSVAAVWCISKIPYVRRIVG